MRSAVKSLLAVPLAALFLHCSVAAAAAAPGDPDPAFGPAKDGIVTLGPDGDYLAARAVAIQPDGRIVVAGQICSGVGQGCDIALARLDADGGLDTTFNKGGAVPGLQTVDLGQEEHAEAVQVLVDGRIDASGYTCNTGHTKCTFLLIRLLPDGQFDTTFGNSGVINPDYPAGDNNDAEVNAMALQPDGKMVMGGFAAPDGTDDDFTLMRYYPNTVDLSFANGGIVTSDFAQRYDRVNALALQPDGMIVAAGETCVAHTSACSFAVARFKSGGLLNDGSAGETPFGTAGGVTTDVQSGGDNRATAVTLQPDGKIVAAGQACTLSHSTCAFAVVRYTADGALDTGDGQGDPGFNQGTGKVMVPIGTNAIPEAVAWQPDGRIVVAGYTYDSVTSSNNLALVRLNADGTLDQTFGAGGTVITDLGGGDQAYAMALQPDGRIVVAGTKAASGGARIAVVRYIAQDPGWAVTPSPFRFTTLHDVAPGSVQISDSMTVQGLAGGIAVPVVVLNGSYDKNGSGTYTTALGWARNGDRFTVAQRASTVGGQSATAGLLIGGVASVTNPSLTLGTPSPATFTVTTVMAAPPGGSGGAGPLGCAALGVLAAARGLGRRRSAPAS